MGAGAGMLTGVGVVAGVRDGEGDGKGDGEGDGNGEGKDVDVFAHGGIAGTIVGDSFTMGAGAGMLTGVGVVAGVRDGAEAVTKAGADSGREQNVTVPGRITEGGLVVHCF